MKTPMPQNVKSTTTNFISEGQISDSVIDGLLDFWETCDYIRKVSGEFGSGVNKSIKNSVDLPIPPFLSDKRVTNFMDELNRVLSEYLEVFPYARMAPMEISEPFNIQWYPKAVGGYHRPHCERTGTHKVTSFRHLAWMTYLNTVNVGGETYWVHQDYKCAPVKGKTLIWPVDWTHVHHGLPAPNEEKIIATGWISYT